MASKPQFREVIAPAWQQAAALVFFSFLANVLLLASAIYMLQVYDRVLSSASLDTLLWLTVAVIGAIATYGFLEQARRQLLGRVSQWLDDQLSAPVVEHAIAANLECGNVEAGLTDVADLRSFLGGDSILTFLDAPWTPVFLLFIWLLHPMLGAVGTLGGVLLFGGALANEFLTRRGQQETTAGLRRNQSAASRFIEGAETICSLGMVGSALERWRATQRALSAAQGRLTDRTTTISSISRSLRLALQVAILGVGAYYVLKGELTPGAMIAASIVLSRALAPIERSLGAWRSFVAARAARRNLARLFGEPAPAPDVICLPRPNGRLQVEDVDCVAPGTQRCLLTKISFELSPGEICAVIGSSGSGKSTLCRLLVGAWKPSLGHVRLDGAEVSAWPADQLGPHIGYLPQQVELFPGTVAENIARFRAVDSSEVIAAARLAGVHDMVLRLPLGYQTEVGTRGGILSGGQRQRVGLARALFGAPSFVVLDEPNSNLDSEGEQLLLDTLLLLKKRGTTVVIVTHQARLLRAVDRILLLLDGTVRCFGARDELLRARSEPPPRKMEPTAAPPIVAQFKAAE